MTLSASAAGYLRQLGWREFAHHLLFHFRATPAQPLRACRIAWSADFAGIPVIRETKEAIGKLATELAAHGAHKIALEPSAVIALANDWIERTA